MELNWCFQTHDQRFRQLNASYYAQQMMEPWSPCRAHVQKCLTVANAGSDGTDAFCCLLKRGRKYPGSYPTIDGCWALEQPVSFVQHAFVCLIMFDTIAWSAMLLQPLEVVKKRSLAWLNQGYHGPPYVPHQLRFYQWYALSQTSDTTSSLWSLRVTQCILYSSMYTLCGLVDRWNDSVSSCARDLAHVVKKMIFG